MGLTVLVVSLGPRGCYVGQEVTARMKYRNLGKKRLFVVDLEGSAPSKGTAVTLAGKPVGELRTSVPGIGLAMLRLDAIEQYRLKAEILSRVQHM